MRVLENISITTEFIQLDQLLKWMGLTETGGQARFLIAAGKVQVNGQIVKERRKKIFSGARLLIDDQEYSIFQDSD